MRYFVSFLIVIGLIILVFILILKGFSGGSSTSSTIPPLVNYASTSTVVQMTIEGPVTADQNHQSLKIVVGQNQAQFNAYQGYENTLTNTQLYPNNQTAYADFLRALDLAGYTKGDSSSSLSDYRGFCATGDRYIFEIVKGSTDVERYWSTSCGGTHTFDGETSDVVDLFEAQIPDYQTLASTVKI
jgi:hypothetical protein